MAPLTRLLAVFFAALGLGATVHAGRVPAGVTSIGIRSAAGVAASVSRPEDVSRVVKWFDALPRFLPRPCPIAVVSPPDVSFSFRGTDGSSLLLAVDHAPGSCSGSVTYGGNRPALADDGFVAKVSRLLGVDFDENARTAANQREAKRDAARILRLAVLPAGSRHLVKTPNKTLGHGSPHFTPTLFYRHSFWKVHKPLGVVLAFVKAHPPRGAKLDIPSCACGPVIGEDLAFSFPPLPRRVSSRVLSVELAPLAHGWTGIRVNASDVWVVARGADERVPAGVRAIEVRDPHKALVHRFTGPRTVSRIVRWFDALGVVQPSFYHCPSYVLRPSVRMSFLGADGTVLATAAGGYKDGFSDPCDPLTFRVHGFAERPLLGGHFFGRVERLAR